MSRGTRCRFSLRFPIGDVPRWAAQFTDGEGEERLLRDIRPAVLERGWLTAPEFQALCYWKTPRSRPRCRRNSSSEVRLLTQAAFATDDDPLKMGLLRLLQGVDWPSASTLLHFCDRRPYPILDVRALWSLGYSKPPHYTMPLWLGYVACVRDLSVRSGHDMRTVDRALWQYSKARQR